MFSESQILLNCPMSPVKIFLRIHTTSETAELSVNKVIQSIYLYEYFLDAQKPAKNLGKTVKWNSSINTCSENVYALMSNRSTYPETPVAHDGWQSNYLQFVYYMESSLTPRVQLPLCLVIW